jgi:O-antigen/teichoic acid export membrane protein
VRAVNPLISIVRNWSLLAGSQVVASLIAMATMVVVSRTLGDAEFGRLYLALTLTYIVGLAVDFGLSQVVTRAVARDRGLARPYFVRAALVVGAMGVCLYFLTLGFAVALGYTPEVQSLAAIFAFLIVAEGFSQILGALFQAHEQMLVPVLARVTVNAISLALVVPLLLNGHGAHAVAAVIVIAAVLRAALQAVAVRRLEGFRLPAPPPPPWRGLLRAGLPFLAAQELGLFAYRVNVVILGRMASEATVGWYGAATRVMEALNFIPLLLTTATFPVLSRLWVNSQSEFGVTVRKTLDLVLVIAVPVTIILFTLAEDIVGALFTLQSYAPAVPILRIQALSLALMFVDYLLVCALMAIGKERVWIGILAAACVLNPVLNWVLIPAADAQYANGGIGAALATLLAEVFVMACALRALPAGTFGIEAARVTASASALGLVLGAGLLAGRTLGVPWLIAGAMGGAGYLAAVIWLRILPPDVASWARDLILRRVARPTISRRMAEESARQANASTSVDAA